MITDAKRAEIQRLLDQGDLSERQVAQEAEVARETVRRVKLGKIHRVRHVPPQGRCTTCGTQGDLPCPVCATRRAAGIPVDD